MTQDNKAIVYAAIAVLSWSTVASAFKIALRYLSSFELLLVASCTAFLIFLFTLLARNKWKGVKNLSASQWRWFALLGLLNPVTYYLVLFRAYDLLPAQVAQPVNYSWPILLLILLSLFAGQSIPKIKYVGMLLSLGGVVLISAGTGLSDKLEFSVTGFLLAFLSAFLWAGYWMVSNKRKEVDAIIALTVTFFFGSAYLLIASLWMEPVVLPVQALLSGMYVGAFEIGIPFVCFGMAIQLTSNATLVNQMCYLSPFLSLFLIHLVLGEQIVWTTYAGLLLIVVGIVFNQYLAPRLKH
ncbi:DMT family transporter [Bacteroides graminisolvens]|uniref:DMT family transporter n=1 Tax=Bacteroides graminisolvens TaxID=477666 RepID=UPI0023F217DD|nr:DMT family transporter [Bacteroides graminisolvens]MDD3210106.1 DMT family transporter [Bacteroides graminisolvens]